MLRHQVFIPSGQTFDRRISSVNARSLTWFVTPLGDWWILFNGEFGVVKAFQAKTLNARAVETEIFKLIRSHASDWHDLNRTVGLNWRSISWQTSSGLPDHLQERFRLVVSLHQEPDFASRVSALNSQSIRITEVSLTPDEGLRGLLLELHERYVAYVARSSLIDLFWDLIWRRSPWLEEGASHSRSRLR